MNRRYIINEDPRGPIVNLRKYGWVASPSENFSDDGAYFTTYRYYPDGYNPDEKSNFRLTRTNYKGDTYISIRYDNPVTGRSDYIDDLNGVPRQQAVEKFPEVMRKVKALYDKERSEEGPGGKALTDDEVSQVIETAISIANYADLSPYEAYEKALQKLGHNRDDIPLSQERKMQGSVEAALRNAKAFDKDVIKKIASEYIKSAMEHMRNKFTSRGEYKKGYDLDTAMSLATSFVENPAKKGSYIHLSDLPDATQQKIKNWARKRIETLYDFDDIEESLSDALFEESHDDRMQKIDDLLKGKYNYKIVGPRLYLDKNIDDDTLSEIRTLLYDAGIELGTSVGKRVYEPSYTRRENEISTTTLVSRYIKSVTAGITPGKQKGITPTFRYTNGKTIKFEYAFWALGIPRPSSFELDDDMFNKLRNVVKGAVEKLKQWGVVFSYTSIGDYRGTSHIRGAWELDFLKSYVPIPEELS